MSRERKPRVTSKRAACEKVAKALREFGYPDVTSDMISECLDAWVMDRNGKMPRGVIGMIAKRQFDEVEATMPGSLALLKD